ncbi:unnamed protein product, partial [Rotaria sp. Silwood2]
NIFGVASSIDDCNLLARRRLRALELDS